MNDDSCVGRASDAAEIRGRVFYDDKSASHLATCSYLATARVLKFTLYHRLYVARSAEGLLFQLVNPSRAGNAVRKDAR
eukprot:6194516-Pleurochrysis_carterae.AAC.5